MKHDTRKFLESRGLFSHISPFHEDEAAEIIAKLESQLAAPATEAGGLGAELLRWAAGDGWLSSGPSDFCVFCEQSATLVNNPDGYGWDIEHLPDCLHLRAVAALEAEKGNLK